MQHIIDLFKRECGSDWTLEELERLSIDPRAFLVESRGNHLVGAAVARLLSLEVAKEWEVEPNTCLIEEIAVKQKAQGQGLGTLFTRQIIEWARRLNSPAIIALCWESGQRYTSRVMLEKLGFRPIDFIEHAFVGAGCPYCGPPPECTCAATILRMDLC